jgi:hypothetical protein
MDLDLFCLNTCGLAPSRSLVTGLTMLSPLGFAMGISLMEESIEGLNKNIGVCTDFPSRRKDFSSAV